VESTLQQCCELKNAGAIPDADHRRLRRLRLRSGKHRQSAYLERPADGLLQQRYARSGQHRGDFVRKARQSEDDTILCVSIIIEKR
jgi:hypothetical protein